MKQTTMVAALGLALMMTGTLRGDMITLIPVADTAITEGATAYSNSRGTLLSIGTGGSPEDGRALMKFDVAGNIPAGSTINQSNLIVTIIKRTSIDDRPNVHPGASLYRLTSPWGEGTTDARNRTFAPEFGQRFGEEATPGEGDATWSHNSYNGSTWDTPGGDLSEWISEENLGSYASDALGEDTFYDDPFGGYGEPRISESVQMWLDNPQTNYGFIIINTQPGLHSTLISSREGVAPPKLEILFTPPAPVPEPSSLILLGTGLVGLLGYRRRKRA